MKRAIIIFSCIAAVLLTGCKKEMTGNTQKAQLVLSLSSEGEFTDAGAVSSEGTNESEAMTKADVDINNFSLRIYNASGESEVLGWDKYSEVPSVIALDPGNYVVKAHSPGNSPVAWEQPKYAGEQSVSIAAGKTENVALVCTIANMKVTVKCTEKFINEMNPDFVISVSSKDGVLNFTSETLEAGSAGYFDVAPLTLDVRATRKTGGEINHRVEITDVAAKDHHVFTIDASETGYMDFSSGINIDYTLNGKEQDILIDGIEEEPIDDEPVIPVLNSTSIAEGSVDVALNTQSVDFVYSVPVKLAQDVAVTLNDVPVTASVSSNTVTVPLGTLVASTTYRINVPAGAVLNNADGTPAEAASLSFTTVAEEELPGDVAITMSADGYNLDEPIVFSKVSPIKVFDLKVEATNGIDKYEVQVMSEALQGLVTSMEGDNPGIGAACNYTVDLANMTGSHLSFWGGLFGITEPATQVKGKTSHTLSVGDFLPMMAMFAGVGDHVLDITITDTTGVSLKQTVTFRVTE